MKNSEVSNEVFLKAVFGSSYSRAWVTGFPEDPHSGRNGLWTGGRFSERQSGLTPDKNNFFVISLFHDKPEEASGTARRREHFAECRVIVVDDVHAKVDPAVFNGMTGSYQIETSPGNFQYGFILSEPCKDPTIIEKILEAGSQQLGWTGGEKGVTRYCRLPIGKNTKAKCGPGGFQHLLALWNPDVRFHPVTLAERLGLDLSKVNGNGSKPGQPGQVDENSWMMDQLRQRDLVKQVRGAIVDITCPWESEHTDRADTGTSIIFYDKPDKHGTRAGFQCHHGHCENRSIYDLTTWIKKQEEDQKPSLKVNENRPDIQDIGQGNTAFPAEVMTGLAGDFAYTYGSRLEAPAHFFYFCFLACLGSFLSGRLTLNTEIEPQPRLYTLLLGASADDRKSTAIKKTVDFFKQAAEGFSTCWGVGSAEGLQKVLEKSPSLLLCFDEFKQFVGKCKIEASILLPCVNTLYESNNYESWTKKVSIKLENAHLSLLAASTIDTYERTWDRSFTDIGFNNRLFLVPGSGEKKHSLPVKIPPSEVARLKAELPKILQHTADYPELDLTEDAKAHYHQWYMGLTPSIHNKRLDTYALRLMPLLAVNDLKPAVDLPTVEKVLKISNWQLQARQLHDPIDADNAIAKMEERIRRVLLRKPATESKLKQLTNANRAGLFIYDRAKQNLLNAKEIAWDKEAKRYAKTKV